MPKKMEFVYYLQSA